MKSFFTIVSVRAGIFAVNLALTGPKKTRDLLAKTTNVITLMALNIIQMTPTPRASGNDRQMPRGPSLEN